MLVATASAKTIGSTKRNCVLMAISSDGGFIGVVLGQVTEEQQVRADQQDGSGYRDRLEWSGCSDE